MQSKNKIEMGQKDIKGLLLKYSFPAIIGMLSNALYNMVDTIFIGQGVGSLAIAGLSLSFPVQMIIGAFALMFGVGCASVESILFGQKKDEEASKVVGNTILAAVVFAGLYMLATLKWVVPILSFFGASENTLPFAQDYITIVMLGTIPLSFSMVMGNCLRAVGLAKKAMWTMLVGTIINIVFDPILIFGFNMGIKGAAYATIFGQYCGAGLALYYVLKGNLGVKLNKIAFTFRFKNIGKVISLGASTFIQQLGVSLVAIAVNYQLAFYGGDMYIASYGIINRFMSLFLMPMFGFGQGALPLMGYNFGARKIDRVKKTLTLAQIYCICIGVVGIVLALVIPKAMLKMFTSDKDLINLSVYPLRMLFSTQIMIAVSTIGATMFQSTGKGKEAFFLNLLRVGIIFLPLIFILPKYLSTNGVWWSFVIAELLTAIITVIMTTCGLKRMEVEFKK